MESRSLGKPIAFDPRWLAVRTDRLDILRPSWDHKKKVMQSHGDEYERFLNQLKRKQAIDTGIVEQMYDLKRGITVWVVLPFFAEKVAEEVVAP